jgi:hypothetical protein
LVQNGEIARLAQEFAGGFHFVEPGGGEFEIGGRRFVFKEDDGNGIGLDLYDGLIEELGIHI